MPPHHVPSPSTIAAHRHHARTGRGVHAHVRESPPGVETETQGTRGRPIGRAAFFPSLPQPGHTRCCGIALPNKGRLSEETREAVHRRRPRRSTRLDARADASLGGEFEAIFVRAQDISEVSSPTAPPRPGVTGFDLVSESGANSRRCSTSASAAAASSSRRRTTAATESVADLSRAASCVATEASATTARWFELAGHRGSRSCRHPARRRSRCTLGIADVVRGPRLDRLDAARERTARTPTTSPPRRRSRRRRTATRRSRSTAQSVRRTRDGSSRVRAARAASATSSANVRARSARPREGGAAGPQRPDGHRSDELAARSSPCMRWYRRQGITARSPSCARGGRRRHPQRRASARASERRRTRHDRHAARCWRTASDAVGATRRRRSSPEVAAMSHALCSRACAAEGDGVCARVRRGVRRRDARRAREVPRAAVPRPCRGARSRSCARRSSTPRANIARHTVRSCHRRSKSRSGQRPHRAARAARASSAVYAPGGRGRNSSSVLMACVPARVAGVRGSCCNRRPNARAATETRSCSRLPSYRARRVFAAAAPARSAHGVRHGVACLAWTIVGPGNAWIAEAKRQVNSVVGIDSPPGQANCSWWRTGAAVAPITGRAPN